MPTKLFYLTVILISLYMYVYNEQPFSIIKKVFKRFMVNSLTLHTFT